MRQYRFALAAVALCAGGCVQTRQYADVDFAPPQGDYRLLVLRPDVSVASVTTGGLAEQRADWTEQARTNLSDFVRRKALEAAEIDCLERRIVTIPAKDWKAFEAWVNAPAKTVPGLKELASKKPTWQR